MSDTINITISSDEAPINITITEEAPINIDFSEIAVADPSVAQAKLDAEAAELAAEEAAEEAVATVAGISSVVSSEVTTQLATKTTDNISEGPTNLYYTTARFDARFDTRLALKTTDNLTQGSTNKYYSTTLFNSDLASKSTANLTEGSNLYFTVVRVLASVLTGLSTASSAVVTAADTILQAIGKLQAQITANTTAISGKEPAITTLSVAKGGTGSGTTLNNNRVMQSSGGNIVEAAVITANKALVSDANGIPTHSTVTNTELGYVSGVTSAIQTQLAAKAPLASPTFTGTPAAPTPSTSDNSTTLATTAYVKSNLTALGDATVVSKTSAYTVLNTDGVVLADATSAAFTLTLPTAVGISGRQIRFKKTDSSVNAVTIDGAGTETIDGALTKVLSTQNESIAIVSNGTNWMVVQRNIPSQWADASLSTSDFVGFGTVTNISVQSKRAGDSLLIKGKFTAGTGTAVEARVNLKLAGTALTSAGSSKIPSLQESGTAGSSTNAAQTIYTLMETSVGYITFSVAWTSGNALTKINGSSLIGSGQSLTFNACVPINGWEE